MRLKPNIIVCWGTLFAATLVIGCQRAEEVTDQDHGHSHADDHGHDHEDDHDHFHEHDHVVSDHRPADFADAVRSMSRLNREIAEEMASGHAKHADEALHDMTDIVRWLPEIAADSDMPEDQWNEVDRQSAALTDLLEDVRGEIHDGESIDYAATESFVSEFVQSLQEIVDDGAWNQQFGRSPPSGLAVDDVPDLSGE